MKVCVILTPRAHDDGFPLDVLRGLRPHHAGRAAHQVPAAGADWFRWKQTSKLDNTPPHVSVYGKHVVQGI